MVSLSERSSSSIDNEDSPLFFARNNSTLSPLLRHHDPESLTHALSLFSPNKLQEIQWQSSLSLHPGLWEKRFEHVGCVGFEREFSENSMALYDQATDLTYEIEDGSNIFRTHFLPMGDISYKAVRAYPFDGLYVGLIDMMRVIPYVEEKYGNGIFINDTFPELAYPLVRRAGFHIHKIHESFRLLWRKELDVTYAIDPFSPKDDKTGRSYTIYAFVNELTQQLPEVLNEKERVERMIRRMYRLNGCSSDEIEKEIRMRFIVRNFSEMGVFGETPEASPQSDE